MAGLSEYGARGVERGLDRSLDVLAQVGDFGTFAVRAVRALLPTFRRYRDETLRRKAAAFGEGRDSLYRIGARRWLLGLDVSGMLGKSASVEVRLDDAAQFRNVRVGSGFVPARVSGRVTTGRLDPKRAPSLALNSRW